MAKPWGSKLGQSMGDINLSSITLSFEKCIEYL
jgi:hypothetical protein